MNKLNFLGAICIISLGLTASAQAQQYQSNPVLKSKAGITYKTAVTRIEMKSEPLVIWATCEEDVSFEEFTCQGSGGCHNTGVFLFHDTEKNQGGYAGSRCEFGDGAEFLDGHVKWVTKNTKPTQHLTKHFVGNTPVAAPKGAAEACVKDAELITRSILDGDVAGHELAELLKIKTVSLELTDNTGKLKKDDTLKYGPDFTTKGKLVIKSVLNSAGECKKVEKSVLLDELTQRAASEYPKLVQQILADAAKNDAVVEGSPSASKLIAPANTVAAAPAGSKILIQ